MYSYGFQGQERDDEVKGEGNSINFKYRMHDPRVGRFFAVDPLTAKYPHYTPYSFSGNKVIHAVELEGLEEVELNAQASATYTFGSGGQSSFNVNVGIGGSAKDDNFQLGLNVSGSLYNGGLGTNQGATGETGVQGDLTISPSFTLGTGTGSPLPTNTFNSSTLSGVNNTFKYSGTYGLNFVTNTSGRNQQVGSFGVRIGDFNFNTYNDIGIFGGDGDDRWWSGGGQGNVSLGGGNILTFGTEVFTEMRIALETGGYKVDTSTNSAQGRYGTYVQTPSQRAFNNGQTYFRLRTSKGISLEASFSGGANSGFSQALIHNYLPGIESPEFEYGMSKPSVKLTGGATIKN